MANPQQRDDAFRLSMRNTLIIVCVFAILLAAGRYAMRAYNSSFRSLEDFNAVWLAHDMLEIHLSRNGRQWPADWDALSPAFTVANDGYGAPDMAWVKERITIDFDVDPTTLTAPSDAHVHQLHAIRLADGSENGETRNANARLESAIFKQTSPERLTRDGT